MKLKLKLFVEHADATFEFKYLDWVLPTAVEIIKTIPKEEFDDLGENMNINKIPAGLMAICNEIVTESIIGWYGVSGENDEEIIFSPDMINMISPIDKLQIGMKILGKSLEDNEKKV